ncbi:Type IV leader peptidase family protein [Clostridium acidisoli DSM 12555]|uniref:Type IV leader peptidase family protein n=1 Tax=Clostridium acidisoli DSM 12555 TaxID=1121291 RepID=A0A1W1XZP1_9CLOT|nr:prepilin peptidase [Clostridium acidisoli]SMC29001.1 Type IV leader peptidase family protein [Clostridium acidisoli DSM 12555]
MKNILILIIVSIFFIVSSFKLIGYINIKDSQHISCKLINKINLCIVSSILNILLYLKVGLNFEYIVYFILIIFITMTAYIDYFTHYIYKITTFPMLSISFVYYAINIMENNVCIDSFVSIFFSYVMLKVFSRLNWIGDGDVDVFVIISFIIFKDNTLAIIDIILSMSISGLVGIFMLVTKKADLNHRKPLCPSIAIATYIILLIM